MLFIHKRITFNVASCSFIEESIQSLAADARSGFLYFTSRRRSPYLRSDAYATFRIKPDGSGLSLVFSSRRTDAQTAGYGSSDMGPYESDYEYEHLHWQPGRRARPSAPLQRAEGSAVALDWLAGEYICLMPLWLLHWLTCLY